MPDLFLVTALLSVYTARPKSDDSEKSQAEYLMELHKERVKKYKMPLIHIRN